MQGVTVAFKEWALVCAALGEGCQSVILRKGGIAEGRDGFRFTHENFLLFPTYFHGQRSKLKGMRGIEKEPQFSGQHVLQLLVKVEWLRTLTEWDEVQRLEAFHCWTEETVRERFLYEDAGRLHVAFVRVYRLKDDVILEDLPRYGGCRSWVDLPNQIDVQHCVPVLDAQVHEERKAAFLRLFS